MRFFFFWTFLISSSVESNAFRLCSQLSQIMRVRGWSEDGEEEIVINLIDFNINLMINSIIYYSILISIF